MSKIILRKPKFMRTENAMEAYITVIDSIYSILSKNRNLNINDKMEYMKELNELIKKASKAGGFFRVEDFVDYYNNR